MQPRQLVQAWVDAFNHANVDALAGFYAEEAISQKIAELEQVGV
jgi:ketosteroid isomerase-like protein